MKPQYLFLMLVEDMSCEASVGTKHLPGHRSPKRIVLLSYKPNIVSLWVQDDVFVRLFKANEYVHELQLPLDYDARICQYAGCRVFLVEYC